MIVIKLWAQQHTISQPKPLQIPKPKPPNSQPKSMASQPNPPEISPISETLIGNTDQSPSTPFLFTLSQNPTHPDPTGDRIFLVNPFTQSTVVIEGRSRLEALLRDYGGKQGQPPASAASIQSLPTLQITQHDLPCECVICLDDCQIGALAKELPCKHKFHLGCIEKWLRIHGNCPVCRYELPVDAVKNDARRLRREIWVGFTFNNNNDNDNDRTVHDSNPVSLDHEVEG